jgi:hypothetical protein
MMMFGFLGELKMRRLLTAAAGVALVIAGGAPRAETPRDRPGFCKVLDQFASAPPGDRSALFFWSSSSDDTFDIYASMAAQPMDAAAHELYAAYAQTTHYIPLADLKTRLDRCSTARHGRVHVEASEAACAGHASDQPCLSIRRVAPR